MDGPIIGERGGGASCKRQLMVYHQNCLVYLIQLSFELMMLPILTSNSAHSKLYGEPFLAEERGESWFQLLYKNYIPVVKEQHKKHLPFNQNFWKFYGANGREFSGRLHQSGK